MCWSRTLPAFPLGCLVYSVCVWHGEYTCTCILHLYTYFNWSMSCSTGSTPMWTSMHIQTFVYLLFTEGCNKSTTRSHELPRSVPFSSDVPPAGSPQRLTDAGDPRLLKHHPPHPPSRPLPHQPRTAWCSDYKDNFTPPSQFVYVDGVFRRLRRPDLVSQVSATATIDDWGVHAATCV